MLTRRAFLQALGVTAAAPLPGCGASLPPLPAGPLVDFHVHLFGKGDGGTIVGEGAVGHAHGACVVEQPAAAAVAAGPAGAAGSQGTGSAAQAIGWQIRAGARHIA